MEAGLMDALEQIALEAYDRMIGLELADVSVDGCIQRRLRAEARKRAKAR